MPKRLLICAAMAALTACSPPAPPPAAEPPAIDTPPAPASVGPAFPDDVPGRLVDCAGATASSAGLDPSAVPMQTANPDTPVSLAYGTYMALLDKEQGVSNADVATRKALWDAAPAPERDARIALCGLTFPPM